jgi:hypothetical protein
MRIVTALLGLLLVGVLSAQTESHFQRPFAVVQADQHETAGASTTSGQSKIDPAKEADIRRLLELSGAKTLAVQTMNTMQESIKPIMSNSLPPGDYRDKLIDLFFEKFRSKADVQHLMDIAVPVYDKYLSGEEVKGLIKFYETPLGQKTVKTLPQMIGEIQEQTKDWGENLGRESMLEVLAEHPELEKAMEAAQKSQQP